MVNLLYAFWQQVNFKDIIDILIVTFLIYQVLLIIRGTKAVQMIVGVGALGIIFWIGLTNQLSSVNWILEHFFDSIFIIVIILFQDQIRSALATFGSKRGFWSTFSKKEDDENDLNEVAEACGAMSRRKVGGLIVFEKTQGLMNYISTGSQIDSEVYSDLIYAIFQSTSPLHDGAIIISRKRIAAAGCFLPLSNHIELDKHLGSRHRAALGVSEATDAVVVVVSEETGKINLCYRGGLYPVKDEISLKRFLKHIWINGKLNEELVEQSS
jgi:diadenylate cyclase